MNLTQKVGPLPLWGWGAAATGSVVGVVVVRRIRAKRAGASSPAAEPAADAGLGNPMTAAPSGFGGGGGDYVPPGTPAYGPINIHVTEEPEPRNTGVATKKKAPVKAKKPRPKVPPRRHFPTPPRRKMPGLKHHPSPPVRALPHPTVHPFPTKPGQPGTYVPLGPVGQA